MPIINIIDLYQQAFNIAPRYLIPGRGGMDQVSSPEYSGIEIWPEDNEASISPLGTPILEQIMLQGGQYKTFEIKDGKPVAKTVDFESYLFEGWPMIDVSQDKIIVTTNITGREGTVKEHIYNDDHQITIRGILVGEGNSFPYEQRRTLKKVCKVNSTYGVVNRMLTDLDIMAIVIKRIEFTELEGYNNICPYVITAISDRDVLLEIKYKT